MKKIYWLFCAVFVAAGIFLSACVRDAAENRQASARQTLSVEEARAFYETNTLGILTRAAAESQTGVFAPGEVTPDWDCAELSADARIACVDIPARLGNYFQIARRKADGTFGVVPAYNKLLVVRSKTTGELATYIHFFIPDELYDS